MRIISSSKGFALVFTGQKERDSLVEQLHAMPDGEGILFVQNSDLPNEVGDKEMQTLLKMIRGDLVWLEDQHGQTTRGHF